MKVHYINILLFALPLNILVYNRRNHKSITTHTQNNRSLCKCDLYMPNYDNDQEMKSVMENFNEQTQQKFHEYDDRMKTTRQKCKDRCNKEIQKIILKDKLEKQMEEQLTTLETKIDTDDIPTCICEKSLADKVEKGCLRCGSILGAAMPEVGSIGGGLLYALNAWKTTAIAAATAAAEQAGAAAGIKAGHLAGTNAVIKQLHTLGIYKIAGTESLESIIDVTNYMKVSVIYNKVYSHYTTLCTPSFVNGGPVGDFKFTGPVCNWVQPNPQGIWDRSSAQAIIYEKVKKVVAGAEQAAKAEASQVSSATSSKIITEQKGVINTIYMSNQTAIIASIIAIIIIVLIMVIIYLILRYRRKRKMKKKLQYIKLLEQ